MEIFIFVVVHWYLSLFTQTFFLHRYAAHGMFTMPKFWEKVFFILTFITQGSSYLSAYAYGVMHRMHHVYADTEEDPHSPKYDKTLFSMMWRTKGVYTDIFEKNVTVEKQFTEGVPEWYAFEKVAHSWISRLIWAAIYLLFYLQYATEWWMFLFLPMNLVMGPLHGAVINWFAHKYGYTNFKIKDTSKNLLPVDFLMMGEGYHNNHHYNGSRVNFGVKWHEFDPAYPFILLFDKLHIIKIKAEK
jgi:stearoyl-CoA desaturase (delta-9 desaturase)